MYLKRIEMHGFKSFADKTVIELKNGVTSVVGPNGSGKSNISDAIRWVMGEMSAKSLRGSNMQDVIFNGTETRKPQNFAEVSIVLDNTDRTFPIEFDEVVVTRRVFRSGESAYLINKANCRLRDVQELFMDTGLGRDGYSMIGQGNVSQILSTKAEDRRAFFEGAAGVAKFKHRKDEAERKLDGVSENLTRINDIITELEGQLTPLLNQSKKARKYIEIYDEFKGLDVSTGLLTVENNLESISKLNGLLENVTDEMNSISEEEAEFEEKISELYSLSDEKDKACSDANEELVSAETAVVQLMNECKICENDIRNDEKNIERAKSDIEHLERRTELEKSRIAELKELTEQKREEIREITESFSDIQKENTELFERVSESRLKIESLRQTAMELSNTISATKEKINGAELMRKSNLERKTAVEEEIKSFNVGVEATKAEMTAKESLADEIIAKKAKTEKLAESLRAESARVARELEEKRAQLSESRVELNSKLSQKRILEGMENDYEGYARGVKMVLKAPELKKLSIYGALSGLISTSDKVVTAIEIALGGALQNIVVESEEDAKAAINYLKTNKGGRVTFLPVSSVTGRGLDNEKEVLAQNGVVGIASELVSCDKRYKQIIKSLLGRTVVADNMDNAIALSRKFGYRFRVVTLSGEILNSGGAITGGSVNKGTGFLSRANEIKAISAAVVVLNEQNERLTGEIESLEAANKSTLTQLESCETLLRGYDADILLAKNTAEHLLESLKKGTDTENALKAELSEIESYLRASGDEIAGLIGNLRTLEHKLEDTNEELANSEAEHEEINLEKDEKARLLVENTSKIRELERETESYANAQEAALAAIEGYAAEKSLKDSEIEQYRKNIENSTAIITDRTSAISEAQERTKQIKERIVSLEAQKSECQESLKKIQSTNKELSDRLMLLQQERSRHENALEKLTAENESIIIRLWDEYELTPETAQLVKVEIENEKEARQRTAELRAKLKSLGNVNLDSIEEYKNVKERYEFLTAQRKDLEHSRNDLNKVIDSMQELMEEHFTKQFAEINKSFQKVFKELFGGGNAMLALSEPDNVLESGIEIKVQLPGKNLQNINLYSGGEKSFIAIALLFAILAVKPTPFCVLDEIDAALDDVNVSRFATYLKNYMDDTQFVVITHRRGTMESANVLYGVTMQEKGVTKLLSLDIDSVEDDMLGGEAN